MLPMRPGIWQGKVAACKVGKDGFKVLTIHLKVCWDPVHWKCRVLKYGLRDPVRQQLNKMLENCIISEVESSAWDTPIVTPLKLDGKTARICGDYRLTLNRSLLQQSCTTEEPEDVLHKLNGAKVFSKLDLQNAFLQIPLEDDSKALITITTPDGLLCPNDRAKISPRLRRAVLDNLDSSHLGVEEISHDMQRTARIAFTKSLILHAEYPCCQKCQILEE